MDPASILTLIGSVFTTGKVIMSLITNLATLKSKYKSASLMASHLIVRLTTIKAALDEVSKCIATSLQGAERNEQLIFNLESSLESCHVFILMLEDRITRLDQNGIDRQLKGKVNLLWNKSEIQELNNYLSNQISALHLLLTARTESQKLFKKVEDDRSSLSAFKSRSRTSAETSGSHTAFDFEKEIATTNVYQNVTISPDMTSNGSGNSSLPLSKKKTSTRMGLSQNSRQRRTELSSKRAVEWCFEETIPSDCDTNLPNSGPTLMDDTISTTNISDDELQFKTPQWQPLRQMSSPNMVDNPFLDPTEGPIFLPSARSLYENSSDASIIQRNNNPWPKSYQSLQILHYILLSGCSYSGKATLADSIEFLYFSMIGDESWVYGKAIQSYILRCILHTVWEMKKRNVFSNWADRYGLYATGDFEDGILVSHNVWSYKGWPYNHTPETIRHLAKASWSDQGFRETFDAWSSKNQRIKAAESYFRSRHRIWSPSYTPTKEDLLLLFSRATKMEIVWRNKIVKVYDYGGFEDRHKKWGDFRVAIGPETILYTISMMSSEFLKDPDTCQPFVDLVHFEAACKPRYWTTPRCVILFTHLDEFMTNLESRKLNRNDFKEYFLAIRG
ncbi:hypothetical protein EAF00_004421 [Botryotinia globosa]|nr:hypothetical protein EAF00_004421 [Botryotinia globosa]